MQNYSSFLYWNNLHRMALQVCEIVSKVMQWVLPRPPTSKSVTLSIGPHPQILKACYLYPRSSPIVIGCSSNQTFVVKFHDRDVILSYPWAPFGSGLWHVQREGLCLSAASHHVGQTWAYPTSTGGALSVANSPSRLFQVRKMARAGRQEHHNTWELGSKHRGLKTHLIMKTHGENIKSY